MRQITKDIKLTIDGSPQGFRLTKPDAFSGVEILRLLLRLQEHWADGWAGRDKESPGVERRMGRWGQGNPAHPVGGPDSPVPTGPFIAWWMEEKQISMEEAMKQFYTSVTFEKLSDPETGLYIDSAASIYYLFKEEQRLGTFIQNEI